MELASFFRFGGASRKDNDKLVELFSNRTELKKEYARLRDERHELEGELKRQQGETLRLKQKLEYLEGQLTDRNTAASTVVFYQLRGVWRGCARRLVKLSDSMGKVISHRRQEAAITRWKRDHEKNIAIVDQRLVDEKAQIIDLKNQIRVTIETIGKKQKAWHYFTRRRLSRERDALSHTLKQKLIEHNTTLERKKELARTKPPEVEALTVEDRRSINLNVIAMAQFLCGHFAEYKLSDACHAAMSKQLGSINYGDESACEQVRTNARLALEALMKIDGKPEIIAHVRRQAEHLGKFATYPDEESATPEPFALDNEDKGLVDKLVVSEYFASPVKVMSADFWSLRDALLS